MNRSTSLRGLRTFLRVRFFFGAVWKSVLQHPHTGNGEATPNLEEIGKYLVRLIHSFGSSTRRKPYWCSKAAADERIKLQRTACSHAERRGDFTQTSTTSHHPAEILDSAFHLLLSTNSSEAGMKHRSQPLKSTNCRRPTVQDRN